MQNDNRSAVIVRLSSY